MASKTERVIQICKQYDAVNFWCGFFMGVTAGVLAFAAFLKWMA